MDLESSKKKTGCVLPVFLVSAIPLMTEVTSILALIMICKFIIIGNHNTQKTLMLDIPSAKSEKDVRQIIYKLVARQYRNSLCRNERYSTTWNGLYTSFIEGTYTTTLALMETSEISRYCTDKCTENKAYDILIYVKEKEEIDYIQSYENLIQKGETDMYAFCEKKMDQPR